MGFFIVICLIILTWPFWAALLTGIFYALAIALTLIVANFEFLVSIGALIVLAYVMWGMYKDRLK